MAERQRVLIVEDRPDWQSILSKTMVAINWTVDIASTYDQALHLLNHHAYDLAIIDPVLDNTNKYNRDGLRVLVEIHKDYPETALIIVSGSVSQSTLDTYPDLPKDLKLIEKHKWDRETFTSFIRNAMTPPHGQIGKSTVIRMLRSSQRYAPPNKEMPTPPREEERKGKARILIVEDRPDWQVILARTLEDEAWFWRYVPNASLALELLKDKQQFFHVVLLDLRLGDQDVPLQEGEGWQLLDYLSSSGKRTRVIVVSGEASRGDVAALFTRYPIEGFIDKDTFKKNELLGLIYALMAKPKIHIQTLGGFHVWRDEKSVSDFGSHEAELLLKILLAHQGETVPSIKLIKWLLPGFGVTTSLSQPKPALRAIVDTLRHVLEPDLERGDHSAFILERPEGYVLDVSQGLRVDFIELVAKLADGKQHQAAGQDEQAMAVYLAAQALHEGEFLPDDRSKAWALNTRNQVEHDYARLLNRLADLYAKQDDLAKAIETAQLCLKVDAYHESTHRRLMRYHYCHHNKEAALTAYLTWEKLKREFFGEEPSPETQTLRDAIIRNEQIAQVEQSD
jgi:DNA-binding SARP family transcriptional activator/ActR/RegA family two-component response regulator